MLNSHCWQNITIGTNFPDIRQKPYKPSRRMSLFTCLKYTNLERLFSTLRNISLQEKICTSDIDHVLFKKVVHVKRMFWIQNNKVSMLREETGWFMMKLNCGNKYDINHWHAVLEICFYASAIYNRHFRETSTSESACCKDNWSIRNLKPEQCIVNILLRFHKKQLKYQLCTSASLPNFNWAGVLKVDFETRSY